jgi:phosphatidylserine decarboxylase
MTIAAALGVLLAEALILPLAWKWELGVLRVAIAVAVLGLLAAVGVSLLAGETGMAAPLQTALVVAATLTASAAILAYRFYRDPDRVPPATSGAIVSPADGSVIYINHAQAGVLPNGAKGGRPHRVDELTGTPLQVEDAFVVGIAMNFLDVHVNRAPIAGSIVLTRHVPGRFASLKDREMVFENERRTTVIRQSGLEVAVVQIASRLVRQIASFVETGQEVGLGDRIGVIRLGSQVDLVIPATASLQVQTGDQVRAGESVIAIGPDPSVTP